MTRLTYLFTAPDGRTETVKTYPQAIALKEMHGGTITAKYEPIEEPNRVNPENRQKMFNAILTKGKATEN